MNKVTRVKTVKTFFLVSILLAAATLLTAVHLGLIGAKVTPATIPGPAKPSKAEDPLDPNEKRGPPTLVIKSRIDRGSWSSNKAIYPLKGQKIALKIDPVRGASIRWFQIIPDLSKIYKNANHPGEPNPYQWIGFARITYFRRELVGFRGRWEIEPFKEPSLIDRPAGSSDFYHTDVGSFWFQVEVEKGGKVRRSAGRADSDKRGLSPNVFRVSVRDGDGYLGYLASFFNVPGLFGSSPYQSNNYLGADCADVLVAAYGAWKGKAIQKDYCVSMLTSQLPRVTELEIVNGSPDRRLRWGTDIHPGQFIAVKYSGEKQYQHIGVLFSDADGDGVLSPDDLVLHAGPAPLHYSTLKERGFDGHCVVLLPRL